MSAIFRTTPGETYYIAVGGLYVQNAADMRVNLHIDQAPAPSAHDDFGQRLVVPSLPFSDGQDGRIATTAADDPTCGNRTNTYWYTYTPQEDEWVLTFTDAPVFGIYTGSRGALHQVICDSDPEGARSAFLGLTAGTTYHFMAAGGADIGVAQWMLFGIERVPPPPPPLRINVKIDSKARVLLRSGEARINLTITCSREAYINIGGQLSQRLGRRTISGAIEGAVYCNDTVSTSVLVRATKGRFLPLDAKAAVHIEAFDMARGEIVSANRNKTVRLRLALR
jgi:hypothetical protein